MTVIAQQQSKHTGRWFRCRREKPQFYVIERTDHRWSPTQITAPDVQWDEQATWWSPREEFVVAEMRRLVRHDHQVLSVISTQ